MVSSEDRNIVGSKIGNACQTGSGADFAAHCSQPPAVAVWYCSRIHRVRPSEFEAMDPAGRFEQSHRRVPDRAHANRGKILPLSTSLANQDTGEQCTIRLAAFPGVVESLSTKDERPPPLYFEKTSPRVRMARWSSRPVSRSTDGRNGMA